MSIRVVAWGTGNVGKNALIGIDARPDLELVGLWVSNPDKVGKDAGRLAGLDRDLGVLATNDVEEIIALQARLRASTARWPTTGCSRRWPTSSACCGPASTWSPAARCSSSTPPARRSTWPRACRRRPLEGGVSLYVNGIDPGFANDWLPLSLTSISERIDQVRCSEILNYNTYDQGMIVFDVMGFGKPMDHIPMLLEPGILTMAWGSVVHQIAAGLGVELDDVEEFYERLPATESFDIDSGRIEEGTVAGLRFEVRGKVGDKAVVVLEHVTRVHDDIGPDWPQPAGSGLLPGRDQGRAQLHPRPPAARHRRRPQHRRPQGHRDATGQRGPRRRRRRSPAWSPRSTCRWSPAAG